MESSTLESSNSKKTRDASQRARILIADDNQSVLDRVISVLKPHFEIVGTVSNGRILVEEALRLQPDIIVSDILMPEFNGLQAARYLRQRGSIARFIFLSVYERAEFVRASFEEGGMAYVTKTRMCSDLISAVNEVICGRQFISPSVQE